VSRTGRDFRGGALCEKYRLLRSADPRIRPGMSEHQNSTQQILLNVSRIAARIFACLRHVLSAPAFRPDRSAPCSTPAPSLHCYSPVVLHHLTVGLQTCGAILNCSVTVSPAGPAPPDRQILTRSSARDRLPIDRNLAVSVQPGMRRKSVNSAKLCGATAISTRPSHG